MKPLKVSIIIPTFNRAAYLPQTIESALAQDYSELEVIVSDNASTDGTGELVRKYEKDPRFTYVRNETNLGCVPNYRRPVRDRATGDFYLILSDDDYLTDAGYISKAVSLIRKDPSIVMVYAQGHILHEDTGAMTPLHLPFHEIEDGKTVFLSRGTVKPMDFTHCNVLFHRETALSFRPYENEWNLSCDSELFLLMCLAGKVGVIKDFVSVYRVHATSMTGRIRRDPLLLINNLEYVLRPYTYARERKSIPESDLRSWERRLLQPEVRSSLLWCALYHRDVCKQLARDLRKRYPEPMEKIFSDASFWLKFAIAGISRPLFWLVSGAYRRELSRERKRAVRSRNLRS